MGEIILTVAFFIIGLAAGYIWRDRVSKARHAKVREERRPKWVSGEPFELRSGGDRDWALGNREKSGPGD